LREFDFASYHNFVLKSDDKTKYTFSVEASRRLLIFNSIQTCSTQPNKTSCAS